MLEEILSMEVVDLVLKDPCKESVGIYRMLLHCKIVVTNRDLYRTDDIGAYPVERPVTSAEVVATVYHCLGIDHEMTLPGPGNRPIPLVYSGTKPIMELV